MERLWIALAGLSGAAAVAADAAARHLLAGDAWRIDLGDDGGALRAGPCGGADRARRLGPRHCPRRGAVMRLVTTGWCFVAGLVPFCGSLYLRAAGVPLDRRASHAGRRHAVHSRLGGGADRGRAHVRPCAGSAVAAARLFQRRRHLDAGLSIVAQGARWSWAPSTASVAGVIACHGGLRSAIARPLPERLGDAVSLASLIWRVV